MFWHPLHIDVYGTCLQLKSYPLRIPDMGATESVLIIIMQILLFRVININVKINNVHLNDPKDPQC